MEIIWQAHHAVMSDRLRARATTGVEKVAKRLDGTTDATIRFEREGTRCRVEIIVRVRRKSMVAEGHGRYYGPALSMALAHLSRQVTSERRTVRDRAARASRA